MKKKYTKKEQQGVQCSLKKTLKLLEKRVTPLLQSVTLERKQSKCYNYSLNIQMEQ